MNASEIRIRVYSPCYAALWKENSMKSLFLPLYGNMENSRMKACAPTIAMSHSVKENGRLCFVFSVVLHFTEHFKRKSSVINTYRITAVTKSSMKP